MPSADGLELGDAASLEGPLHVVAVPELVHVADSGVLLGLYGLATAVDHLRDPEARVTHLPLDRGDVVGRHVLGRVDPEAVHPQRTQVAEVRGDGGADRVPAGVEVGESHEFAVLHVVAARVVLDGGAAGVEVGVLEVPGIVVLRVGRAARARPGAGGHVVDDGVGDDLDACGVTGLHHAGERVAVTEAARDPVADRLVGGPPLVALYVLRRR